MTIYYAAVENDPLTSGSGSYISASVNVGRVRGEDGRSRRLVFIGDSAWCSACKSEGVVIGGAPLPDKRRLLDLVNGGRRQAVGGDSVRCQCPIPPTIIAQYGHAWKIVDRSESAVMSSVVQPEMQGTLRQDRGTTNGSTKANAAQADKVRYDDRYVLLDENFQSMPNTRYAVQHPGGQVEYGITDAEGSTHLLTATVSAEPIRIYVAQ